MTNTKGTKMKNRMIFWMARGIVPVAAFGLGATMPLVTAQMQSTGSWDRGWTDNAQSGVNDSEWFERNASTSEDGNLDDRDYEDDAGWWRDDDFADSYGDDDFADSYGGNTYGRKDRDRRYGETYGRTGRFQERNAFRNDRRYGSNTRMDRVGDEDSFRRERRSPARTRWNQNEARRGNRNYGDPYGAGYERQNRYQQARRDDRNDRRMGQERGNAYRNVRYGRDRIYRLDNNRRWVEDDRNGAGDWSWDGENEPRSRLDEDRSGSAMRVGPDPDVIDVRDRRSGNRSDSWRSGGMERRRYQRSGNAWNEAGWRY